MKTFLVICVIISVFNVYAQDATPIRATAVVKGTDTNIRGNVTFSQNGCGAPVLIELLITGLCREGEHGFHIHEKGDLSDGCTSLGAHYNPDKLNHGAPLDDVRHAGDLGNIRVDVYGVAKTAFSDSLISLTGPRSIIGRGIIVHDGIDDLGKGGHPDSLKTGNAGGRVVCGVIGYFDEEPFPVCNAANTISSMFLTFLTPAFVLLHLRNYCV